MLCRRSEGNAQASANLSPSAMMEKMTQRRYGVILLVALLFTIYAFTNPGRFHVVDEVSLFGVTESIALRGAVDTNAIAWTQWVNSPGEVLGAFGPEGDVYSKKGPAPAFLATPLYLLLRAFAHLDISLGLLQGTLLWNGLVTALTAALVWLAAARLGYSDRVGALLSLLFGVATIAWPYANQFFGEPLSALGLFLVFYGLLSWRVTRQLRWSLAAGVGAGLAIATVTANALMVAIIVAYGAADEVMPRFGRAGQRGDAPDAEKGNGQQAMSQLLAAGLLFIMPVAAAGLFLFWYNFLRFGSPFETGYHFDAGEGFNAPFLQGLYGLLLSPYRGMFWFTPLFFASMASFIPFMRRHKHEGLLIAAVSVVFIGLYSKWWMWWGGFSWGPRFLVPLAPFWVLLLAPVCSRLAGNMARLGDSGRIHWGEALHAPGLSGWLLIVVALLSTVVQLAAVAVNYVNFEVLLRSIYPTDWSNPLAFGPPAQPLTDLLNSPVAGQFKLMNMDFRANTDLVWLWADGNIQLLLLGVGGAVLLTLAAAAAAWWIDVGATSRPVPSRPVRWLVVILPLLFAGVWINEASRHPHYGDAGYRAVISHICEVAEPSDVIITVAPYAYQVPMNWLGAECNYAPPVIGYATDSMEYPEAQQVMARTLDEYDLIWFVTGGLPPNDPENTLERWLADNAYKAFDMWYGDFRLLAYATPARLEDVTARETGTPLVGAQTSEVMVESVRAPETVSPGEALPIEIAFRLAAPSGFGLRWFVQLLTLDGFPVALLDTAPDDGYTPFSDLPAEQELVERAGLLLPPDLPTGEYQVIAGIYNPELENAERLRAPDGSDFVHIGRLVVQ
jgi:hypothetical protein